MQTLEILKCGMCGRSLATEPKSTRLFDVSVHESCSKSFNQKRLYAVLVDIVIALVLLFVIGISMRDPSSAATEDEGMSYVALAVAGTFLLFRDAWRGISPGKAMFGLQVVDTETDGPISVIQSLQRNVVMLGCLSPSLPAVWGPWRSASLAMWVIAFRMRAGPRDGEGWAHTRVIDRKMRRAPVFSAADLDDTRRDSLAA